MKIRLVEMSLDENIEQEISNTHIENTDTEEIIENEDGGVEGTQVSDIESVESYPPNKKKTIKILEERM